MRGNHKPLSPNRKIPPQQVKPSSVRSVISAVYCCSNNELTESKYFGVLPPEEFMLRCNAGGRIKAIGDVSFHNRVLWLVWNQFPLHILFPWGEPWPHKYQTLRCGASEILSVSSTRSVILCLMMDTRSNYNSLITDSGVNNKVYDFLFLRLLVMV